MLLISGLIGCVIVITNSLSDNIVYPYVIISMLFIILYFISKLILSSQILSRILDDKLYQTYKKVRLNRK